MKFDPITKYVYTDNDEFVKTLNCPFKIGWDNLEDTKTSLGIVQIVNTLFKKIPLNVNGVALKQKVKII